MSSKIWFITGVSGGFGKQLFEAAAAQGHTVVGTVRQPGQVAALEQVAPGRSFGNVLDVNDHAAVGQVLAAAVARFGRLDVVVNNAGYGLVGAVEETTMQQAREQLETNFFGALAVTQAALPHMRAAGSGHLVQISSIGGLSAAPGLGLYNASKFALEGLSEALAREVAPLGLKVTIVEPGTFRTEWAGASMRFTDHPLPEYAPTAGYIRGILQKVNGHQPGDPRKAAEAILQAVAAEKPPLRLLLGKDAVQAARQKLDAVRQDLDAWEAVSTGTDF